jgi:ribosome-associated toxin RatA of RatAB toxin-antitoxin module
MAHHITHTIRVNASADKIWSVLSDFSSIERTSHAVESSPLLSQIKKGVGTKRKCYFYDNKSVVEEIIRYEEGRSFRMVLSEFSMPMKSIEAELSVEKVNENSCDITMAMDFIVKGGLLGKIMGVTLLKPVLKNKVLKNELIGLAYHAISGKLVGHTMPESEELKLLKV